MIKLIRFIVALLLLPIMPAAIIVWSILDCFHDDPVASLMIKYWFNMLTFGKH